MHNSLYNNNYQTSQQHRDKLYERFEKEQDSVNFIKTLLKLKQKTPSTLTTSSNTIQPYTTVKTLPNEHNKLQSQTITTTTNNNNILHQRRSSHRVEQGMLFKHNIKINQQNILSRNTNNNNNNNNIECNKDSLTNVSQGKIKAIKVNKVKQNSNVNKDKKCIKKSSILNVKKYNNVNNNVNNINNNNNGNNHNKYVFKPKKNDNLTKNNKVIVVNRINNNNNNNKNNSLTNKKTTITKNKLLLSTQHQHKRKSIPTTVINLFINDDNNINTNNNTSCTTSTTKTTFTSPTNHIRNLSDRIHTEHDFLKLKPTPK